MCSMGTTTDTRKNLTKPASDDQTTALRELALAVFLRGHGYTKSSAGLDACTDALCRRGSAAVETGAGPDLEHDVDRHRLAEHEALRVVTAQRP